ncbi:MAG: hypothetical protein KGI54_16210 [Pseudomonadota bacterium]|nr:hypothetical protein [Pseudomonadota bacterium]
MPVENPITVRLTDAQLEFLHILAEKDQRKTAAEARVFINECLVEYGFNEWLKERNSMLNKK